MLMTVAIHGPMYWVASEKSTAAGSASGTLATVDSSAVLATTWDAPIPVTIAKAVTAKSTVMTPTAR